MYKHFPSNKIYVSKSEIPLAGNGVFAAKAIRKGGVIEMCPYIEISKEELESIENSTFISYVYFFGKNKDRMLLALGFGSYYNHSHTPNAMYKISTIKKVVEFSALQNIKKNEEISVNYNQGNSSDKPLWFE